MPHRIKPCPLSQTVLQEQREILEYATRQSLFICTPSLSATDAQVLLELVEWAMAMEALMRTPGIHLVCDESEAWQAIINSTPRLRAHLKGITE
jgi:hypothetical protein